MNPYDLFVSDWDMTLVPPPGVQVGQRTRDVLAELARRDVHIVLASGRPTPGLINLVKFNDIDLDSLHIIGFNGATASHGRTPEDFLFSSPLPPLAVRASQEYAQRRGLEFLIPTASAIYTSAPDGFFTMIEAVTADVPTAPLSAWEPETTPAMKAEMIIDGLPDEVAIQEVRDAVRARGAAADLVFSAPGLLEITRTGANKGTMLSRLCTHLGIAMDRVVAFGDNHNDIALLEAAGAGFAVGAAVPELRAVATDTIGNVEDEAVAEKLSSIFRID